MTNTLKVNLDKTYTSLKIVSAIAGIFISCFVVYSAIDNRIDKLEQDQAVFKGVIDERTRTMAKRVDEIWNVVTEWSPDGQVATKD